MTPANDNVPSFIAKPRIAFRGKWVDGTFHADTPHAWLGKDVVSGKTTREERSMKRQSRRIAKRQSIGNEWDGRADNDNINWPLATSLIREGNSELLKAAFAYRRIHEQAHSGSVLGGKAAILGEGMALDRHIHIRDNGTIAYKHIRQSEAANVDIPPKMKIAPFASEDDGVERNSTRIPKPWDGDRPVNDMIDAASKLSKLRHRLGVLVEPLEMAVIDGATYQAIGNTLGVSNRAGAIGAGCAAVHMGLISIRDMLGNVKRRDLAA